MLNKGENHDNDHVRYPGIYRTTQSFWRSRRPSQEAMLKAMVRALGQLEESNLKVLATKADIKLEIEGLKRDIAESKAETIKWMFGVATGQAMFMIAILKMFPSH
ncbi:MAG: hypothetical protein HQL79_11555 [Magnetococcales bacterium]|nr:hypothetical protein [Magnetococcales bacterium]